jgi:transposase
MISGMGRRLRLEPHLAADELERRYRAAKEPHERSWWQIVWLLAKGQTATMVAESTGYSRYWIGQIARRYNEQGPEAMHNRRYTHSHRAQPLLSPEQLAELAAAVRGSAPEGDVWVGRTVADWMSQKLGRPVSVYVGWAYLVRLDGKRRKPRPRHVHADAAEQDAFKKSSDRSSRRWRPPSPTRRSSSGRSTSTASA